MEDRAGRPVPAERAGRGIAVAAAILMLGNVLSRVLGLVREQVAAGTFGAGDAIAALSRQSPDAAVRPDGERRSRRPHPGAGQAGNTGTNPPDELHVGGALVSGAIVTGSLAALGVILRPSSSLA